MEGPDMRICDLRILLALGLLATTTASGGDLLRSRRARRAMPLPPPPAPVGALSAQIFQMQERNAEASDFVIYEHEFQMYSTRLNYAGEDHVKQIAARIHAGMQFPVLVERSQHSVNPNDKYKYPVHLNPELDLRRREVIVQILVTLGVPDAEQRVVISPSLTAGYEASEAINAYLQGIQNFGFGGTGGYGGGFGGFGGGFFGGWAF
jgi:hypothetical protein